MSNASIDPSLRPQGETETPKRPSPKAGVPIEGASYSPNTAQNGPYPHRPPSAGMSDIAQQLAHAVEGHHPPAHEYQPQHTPMGPPSAQYAHYGHDVLGHGMQASPGDDGGDKKQKIKTTRACDECRRKKIKCDGEGEKPGQKCGNCLRTNAECLYTKPAQKRGPSRGYIRELSDRVASLEQGGGIGASPMTPNQSSPFFTPGPDTGDMRGYKRTLSMSEHPASATMSTPTGPPYPRGPIAPGSDTVRVQFELNGPPVTKPLTGTERTELNGWMHIAQKRFPLFPDEIEAMEQLLNSCPDNLRDVFVKCLRATLSLPDSPDRALYREAYTAALGLMHQPKTASPLTNVVHLQVCVLLVYLSNTAGPESQQTGPEPDGSIFLAKALAIASHLKLHNSDASDPKAQLELWTRTYGRRAYGYLQLIYNWTAIAHGPPSSNAPGNFRLKPADGHYIPFDAFLLMCMLPDLEMLRVHVTRDAPIPAPSVRLDEYLDAVKLGLGMAGGKDPADELLVSLTHSCMTIYRFLVYAKDFSTRITGSIVKDAANVIKQFAAADLTFFPIAHQTLGLAVFVLLQASEDKAVRDEALKALGEAKGILEKDTLHEDGWRGSVLKKVTERLNVKEGKDKKDEAGKDFEKWLKGGYMEFFG